MASIFSATGISLSLLPRNPSLSKPLNHAPQTIVACCVLHNICQIAGEPEPELFKDPKGTVVPPLPIVRPLESEKSFYYFGRPWKMIFKKVIRGSCQGDGSLNNALQEFSDGSQA